MLSHAHRKQGTKSQSNAGTASLSYSKGNTAFRFIDNRPEAMVQRKLQEAANKNPRNLSFTQLKKWANEFKASQANPLQAIKQNNKTMQLAKVTVRNQTDSYTSGWLQAETQSTGVESGPQNEAARVEAIAGGTWVGGHMVNDRMGGTGGYSNIVPITSSMNGRHKTIENAARNKIGNGLGNYIARYHMNILDRKDFRFHNGDEIANLPVEFQQSYDYRLKNGGPVSSFTGQKLNMFDTGTQLFT